MEQYRLPMVLGILALLPVTLDAQVDPSSALVWPQSFDVTLPFGSSSERHLSIGNGGSEPFVWTLSFSSEENQVPVSAFPALEQVLENLNANSAALVSEIPNRFDFSDGTAGTSISDGGSDMFDSGNTLRTNLTTSNISYSDGVIATNTSVGPNGRYFTRKFPGLFIFAADLDGASDFLILGGAGDTGTVNGTILSTTIGGRTVRGFIKRNFASSTPSVNHLIIVDDDTVTHSFPNDPNLDNHTVSGLAASTRLYYLMFGSPSGGFINDDDMLAIMRKFLESAGPEFSWLIPSAESGFAAPEDSAEVTLTFHATVPPGDYSVDILVDTNNPAAPTVTVPVNLSVTPAPVLVVTPPDVTFDPTRVGVTSRVPLTLSNEGNAALEITSLSVTGTPFEALVTLPIQIHPGESLTISALFTPAEFGQASPGSLEIDSNSAGGETTLVSMTGIGLPQDASTISHGFLHAAMESGESMTFDVTLTNNTVTSYQWQVQFAGFSTNDLTQVLARLDENFAAINSLVPNRFDFSDGVTGNLISDGGNDMFDSGNILRTDLAPATNMNYSDGVLATNTSVGPNGQYFTRKHPGLFIFAGDLDGASEFMIDGGAGDTGTVEGAEFVVQHRGVSYRVFAKRSFGSTDPSVNHLMILEDAPGLSQSFPVDPNLDDHTISGLWGETRLYYLLFASTTGGRIADSGLQDIAVEFLKQCVAAEVFFTTQASGTIGPVSSGTIPVTVETSGLPAGTYLVDLVVESVSGHSTVSIPIQIDLSGEPSVDASPLLVDFGSLFLSLSATQSLEISNPGTATLIVDSISFPDPALSTDAAFPIVILPGSAKSIDVTFSPTAAVAIDSTVAINSNDPLTPVFEVAIQAVGVEPPDIAVPSPDLEFILDANESETRIINIENLGLSPLVWSANENAGPLEADLEDVLEALNDDFASVTDLIPNRFNFFDGVTGSSINDGGGDMFDGGNSITTDLSTTAILYSDNAVTTATGTGPNGRYFTRKFEGLFVFVGDLDGASDFLINGDLGADGSGSVSATDLVLHLEGTRYRGFVKRVHGAGDPSVNHLIIVEDTPGLTHQFAETTQTDRHTVHGLPSQTRVFYLLYASTSGGFIDDAATLAIMEAFIRAGTTGSVYLDLSPDAGIIPPGETGQVQVTADATGFIEGTYPATITILSNDPDEPVLVLPVGLTVIGTPIIVPTPASLEFNDTFPGLSETLSLNLANPGSAALVITAITPPHSSITVNHPSLPLQIAPLSILSLDVTFAPGAVLVVDTPLQIESNDPATPLLEIPVSAIAPPPPSVSVPQSPIHLSAELGSVVATSFEIRNDGTGPLEWNVVNGVSGLEAPLEDVLAALDANPTSVNSLIPNRFDFTNGDVGTSISDGGSDMFDTGNIIRTDLSTANIAYSNRQVTTAASVGSNGRYFTRKFDGLFVFAGDLDGASEFIIDGGAADIGTVDGAEFVIGVSGVTYRAFVKRNFGDSSPSVNHLFLVEDDPSASHSFPLNAVLDDDMISGLSGQTRIFYLMFGSTVGGEIPILSFVNIAREFLETIADSAPWLAAIPPGGTLAPGEVATITVAATTALFSVGGTHHATVRVVSNDPLQPSISIPITFVVGGIARINLNPLALVLPDVFPGQSSSATLDVSNSGTEDLILAGAVYPDPSIQFEDFFPVVIPPGGNSVLTLGFSPTQVVSVNGPVRIFSNDPAAIFVDVPTTAVALSPPVIDVNPSQVAVNLNGATTATIPLQIANNGPAPLNWTIEGGGSILDTGLEDLLSRIDQTLVTVDGLVPNRFIFSDGITGTSIGDGGSDMFDSGNFLRTNLSATAIPYSDGVITTSAGLGSSGRYFTRKIAGVFVFVGDLDGASQFNINGGLGADGAGQITGAVLNTRIGGKDYTGFVKRVHGVTEPSVNHLIIVEDQPGQTHTFPASTDLDDHSVLGLTGATRVFYLLYASASGGFINDSTTRNIMETFIDELRVNLDWLNIPVTSGTTVQGAPSTINLQIDVTGLPDTLLQTELEVLSNDPSNPSVIVPVLIDATPPPPLLQRYTDWLALQSPGSSEALSALEDHDGDRVSNVIEFVFAGAMFDLRSNGDPPRFVAIGESGVTLRYTRRSDVSDGEILFQSSTNLEQWRTLESGSEYAISSSVDNGDGTVTVDVLVIDITPIRFLRSILDLVP